MDQENDTYALNGDKISRERKSKDCNNNSQKKKKKKKENIEITKQRFQSFSTH